MNELREAIEIFRDMRECHPAYSPEEKALDFAIDVLNEILGVFEDLGLNTEGHMLMEADEGFEGEFDDVTLGRLDKLRDLYENWQATAEGFNKGLDRLRLVFEVAGLQVW